MKKSFLNFSPNFANRQVFTGGASTVEAKKARESFRRRPSSGSSSSFSPSRAPCTSWPTIYKVKGSVRLTAIQSKFIGATACLQRLEIFNLFGNEVGPQWSHRQNLQLVWIGLKGYLVEGYYRKQTIQIKEFCIKLIYWLAIGITSANAEPFCEMK